MDELRQQLMQSYFNQMSEGMQNMSPEHMQRMKDMLAELNQMLEQRERGRGARLRRLHGALRRLLPRATRRRSTSCSSRWPSAMAAMQAMLNSMTPEQRAQLQELAEQLLEDMDLRWQMDQLGQNLQQRVPADGLGPALRLPAATTRCGFAEAMPTLHRQLGDLDQLENLLRSATSPGALAEVDLDQARDLLGDDAAASLERLAELAKMLEDAGLIEQREGRLELTPEGHARASAATRSRDLFTQAGQGPRRPPRARAHRRRPRARLRAQALRVRRPVPPRRRAHGPQRDRRAAARGTPVRLSPDDFEVERTEHAHPVGDRADARPVAVDADARQLPAGQEGGDGAALADHDRSSRATTSASSASARSPARSKPEQLPEVSLGLRVRHQHAARASCSPASMLATPDRHQADHHDHRRRADRPHHARRRAVLRLPARPARRSRRRCARCMRCTKDGIRINTFMLDANRYLQDVRRAA